MKLTYKHRLFLYFFLIFTLFTVGIVILERTREQKEKTEALENKLDTYAVVINAALQQNTIDTVLTFLPEKLLRVTLIDKAGTVLYDNAIDSISLLENHLQRPEIIAAQNYTNGSNIRISESNNRKYLYYAKSFSDYYIRVALPYNIYVRPFLQTDNLFLYYVLLLFVVMLFLISYVSGRFGKSVERLRAFTFQINGDEKENMQNFIGSYRRSQDELDEIADKILLNYQRLKESQRTAVAEREKLLQHVYSSEEGLCFFSADRNVQFYNGLFIQYLNIIEDEPLAKPVSIFNNPLFDKVVAFLSTHADENYFETQIGKQGKYFSVRVNIFDDSSFEIIINDITKQEKNRTLKQEITGNIAHELRTPVTSIRGYLETMLEQSLPEEMQKKFLQKAFNQTIALSQLIQDMSLLTKINSTPQAFQLNTENISLSVLLEEIRDTFATSLQEKNIRMQWDFKQEIWIKSNRTLLYSVFRNLTDNAIRYAGENINIIISCYDENRDFYSISFADTGAGISGEQHLNRLFDRFYRVNEGRTRDTGGTGLGLSIVKNAIAFYKGSIVAKNRAGGGLEFLFQLPKGKQTV